ncbi:methyl-accepting chemotaxis protein [Metabacillus bambusae]|uniref:Methyl-accepting chemotaxis protein n=1 Tax=Metabacillus bambusae TaxID=2795218 RepID=A0ABS3N3D4_9BACI|nr:methyl-accepting chemotaxis protein [Metabacillus bambusae]MBO1512545.1 methyl-accepting chemotaxis protein [Metabacillus bambusae]
MLNYKRNKKKGSKKLKQKQKKKIAVLSYIKTIRGKIVVSFGLLAIVLLLSATTSYTNMTKLENEIDYLIKHDLEINRRVQDLSENLLTMETSQRGFVITGLTDFIYPFENGKYEISSELEELKKLFKDSEEQLDKLTMIENTYEKWLTFSDTLVNTRKTEGLEGAATFVEAGEGTEYMDSIQTNVEMIITDQKVIQVNRIEELNNQVSIFKVVTVSLTIFAILLSIFFALSLTRGIRLNINKISSSILEIANAGGNLTKRIEVKSQDELADLANDTNKLIDGIAMIIRQVSEMAQNVTATTQELLASAEETTTMISSIADASSEIASGSENTELKMKVSFEKMQSLEDAAKLLNDQAETVKTNSIKMQQFAQNGGESVRASSQKMNSIEETMLNTSLTVEALGKKSNDITSIISSITDIAEQTNLLALNAAIEAARAGEHGKGFAVVADEVRRLAVQSQEAARGVKDIINSIQEEVKVIITQNHEGVKEVISGVELTNQTNASFDDIVKQTQRTTKVVNAMVDHIQQTLLLSKEVADSFGQVIEITSKTTLYTEKTATASEQGSAAMQEITASTSILSKQAEKLMKVIENFKL